MAKQPDHTWLRDASTSSGKVRELYDQWAETYDETLAAWGYEAPAVAARMLRAVVSADASIIDVGCGTGLTGSALLAAGFAGPIDGLDLSPASIIEARKKGIYRSLRAADLQALPLPCADGTYDAAFCVGVLTYVSNDEEVLRELARIVRSGGTVLATERDDLFREHGYEGILERLTDCLEEIEITRPSAYLPGNPDYADEINIFYITGRVL